MTMTTAAIAPFAETAAPGADRWRRSAVAVLIAMGALLLLHGFRTSRVIEDGLVVAWSPKGARQCATFFAAAAAVTWSALRLGRSHRPLAFVAAAWLAIAYGPGAVATTLLVGAAALGLGSRLTAGAAIAEERGLASACVRLAAGLAAIVGVVQVAVHFPVNVRWAYVLVLAGATWAGRATLARDARRLMDALDAPPDAGAGRLATAALVVVLAAHTAVGAVPEAGADALAVHLTVPVQVASHGQWGFDFRALVWALTPMGADWLYTVADLVAGEAAAKLVNVALLVAVALLVRTYARRTLGAPAATLLVAAAAAAPIAFQESLSLWVENLLTLFLLAAATVAARAWSAPRSGDAVAFALCAGGAFATKSLAFVALPLALAFGMRIAVSRDGIGARLGRLAAGAAVFGVVGLAPYVYAYAVTGNPLFPFFNDVFKSPFYGGRFVDERWIGHWSPEILYQMTFRSSLFGELYDGAFGFHHLLLLGAGLVAALWRWPRAAALVLLATAAALAGFVHGTQYIRYLYPFLWAAVVLEAEALGTVAEAAPWLRRGALALTAAAGAANIAFLATGFYLLRDFPVDAALLPEARERFVFDEAPYRRFNETVNAAAGPAARVLYLTEPYGACLTGTPIYSNWHHPDLAARLDADTPEAVAAIMKDERVSHVVIARDQELPAFRAWLGAHGRRLLTLQGDELYAIDAEGTP